jgi:hypothetical protein
MLSRALLLSALLIVGVRFLFPGKWRELGRRFDRAINIILIALAVAYAAQIVWWLSVGR